MNKKTFASLKVILNASNSHIIDKYLTNNFCYEHSCWILIGTSHFKHISILNVQIYSLEKYYHDYFTDE